MSKKNWLILSLALAIVFIGGGAFLFFNPLEKDSSLLNPLSQSEEVKLKTWEDPAGFKFSYPEGIEIDNHEEDEENYAYLELTDKNHPGKILVWMKDKVEKNLDDWIESNLPTGGQIFDSELAGQPAKKVTFASPKKMVTAAFDEEVIILVEVFPENEWWLEVYQQVLSSFELIPLAGEDKSVLNAPGAWQGSGGGSGIIDEGEEIIE